MTLLPFPSTPTAPVSLGVPETRGPTLRDSPQVRRHRRPSL